MCNLLHVNCQMLNYNMIHDLYCKIKRHLRKACHFSFVNLTSVPVRIGADSSLFLINFKEDQNQGSSVLSLRWQLFGLSFCPEAFSKEESHIFHFSTCCYRFFNIYFFNLEQLAARNNVRMLVNGEIPLPHLESLLENREKNSTNKEVQSVYRKF